VSNRVSVGGYVSYLPFGICIWIVVGVAMSLSTNLRSTRSIALICAALILPCRVLSQKPKADPPQPTQFEIARRTFFDFGPPFNYYELFFVRPSGNGTSIERIILTPEEDECFAPAKVEIASASLNESVSALFAGTNPCTIREKELRRELKRCKHCSVFSGATTVMQVQCGTQARMIRADVLDKDLFDPNANTPEHTSWTMQLLNSLDQAVGPGVMDKPMFAVPANGEPSSTNSNSAAMQDLSTGKYDALFQGAPDKPSELYRSAQNSHLPPHVQLVSSTPIAPEVFVRPEYPALARMLRMEGPVSFRLEIDATGDAAHLVFDGGTPILQEAVRKAVGGWRFAKDAIGQEIQATIEFNLNCPKRTERTLP
jgi:TonB family protein